MESTTNLFRSESRGKTTSTNQQDKPSSSSQLHGFALSSRIALNREEGTTVAKVGESNLLDLVEDIY